MAVGPQVLGTEAQRATGSSQEARSLGLSLHRKANHPPPPALSQQESDRQFSLRTQGLSGCPFLVGSL